jgi:dipeptidyl aminopeptidase/acylaminoacyl peptidase
MKSRSSLLLLACAISTAWGAGFSIEQAMSSPFPANLVAASHSGRVAWVFAAKGTNNVWIADAPRFAARQLTRYADDDGEPIAGLRLTPDGRTVVYARGTAANESGRIADPTHGTAARKQEVWAMDVDGGGPRLLGELGCGEEGCEDIQISPNGQFAVWAARKQLWIAPVSGAAPAHQLADIRGTSVSPRWSPDGREIAFVSDRDDHSFITIYELGRDTVRYLAPGVDRDISPRWSPDGHQVAFLRLPGVRQKAPVIPQRVVAWSIWVADAASGHGKEVWQSGTQADDSFPYLSADGSFYFPSNDRIVFASEHDGWNHLYALPASGGTARLLTPGPFEVEDVSLSADRKSVLYSSNQDDIDRRHLWRVQIENRKPEALTKGETIEWSPVETGQDGYVVCLGSSATSPGMPYRITAQGREMLAASALPADFPSSQLVTPQQAIFRSEDGFEIHGQLFVPSGRTTRGPALIFIHGGSVRQMMLGFHYMDYYHYAYAMNQYFASRGYVVLAVNYRTGIMYGRAFREAPNTSWRGGAEYKDIVAAGKYLQALPLVDGKKVGLWGGSYGGYLTAMGLAHNSDMFAAGVDLVGVHDWRPEMASWPLQVSQAALAAAPDFAEASKLAFESSPIAAVEHWKSPVLLIHGDDDRNVAFSQTVDLVQRLREHRVPMEQMVFPDEVHGFLLWKDLMTEFGAAADFFERVLKRGEKVGE